MVDNGSFYSRHLASLLEEHGISFEMLAPPLVDTGRLADYSGVILSGRRQNSQETNRVNSKIVLHCVKHDVKLLGICYGAEILALTLGGTIKRRAAPVKRLETVQTLQDNPICSDTLSVFQSHSYEISKLPDALTCIASSQSCRYEIVQHKKSHIFGTQFHPEMSRDGHSLTKKFLAL